MPFKTSEGPAVCVPCGLRDGEGGDCCAADRHVHNSVQPDSHGGWYGILDRGSCTFMSDMHSYYTHLLLYIRIYMTMSSQWTFCACVCGCICTSLHRL